MYKANAHNHQEYAVGGSKEDVSHDGPTFGHGVIGVFGGVHLDGSNDAREGK